MATQTASAPLPKMKTEGKGWFTTLRLDGAREPWFDKTWRPGEIALVN